MAYPSAQLPSRRDLGGGSDPQRQGKRMNKGMNNLPLPRGASAAIKWGSLPPPAPLSWGAPPAGQGGDARGAASIRFVALDTGNPCCPASDEEFRKARNHNGEDSALCERSVVVSKVCTIQVNNLVSVEYSPIRRHLRDPQRPWDRVSSQGATAVGLPLPVDPRNWFRPWRSFARFTTTTG